MLHGLQSIHVCNTIATKTFFEVKEMVEVLEVYDEQIDRKEQAYKMIREVLTELNRIANKACDLRTAPISEIDDGLVEIAQMVWQQNLWLSIALEWIEDGRSGD
jgi:hypothetical protein